MRIEITVVPRSGGFRVEARDKRIKVFLKSAPESNRANIELVKEMRRFLKADVRIVAGFTSRKKIIEAAVTEEQLKKVLPI